MSANKNVEYQAIVMGASAGGTAALEKLLPLFPPNYPLPIIIVQHLHPLQGSFLVEHYNSLCALRVKDADEKEEIKAGTIYFAPPNYHLLIEDDRTFALSVDRSVNFSRPSIDVLFESAVDAYHSHLIGVILTGANHDGAAGLRRIGRSGGLTIVQDPAGAEHSAMPKAAIAAADVDHILPLLEIGELLANKIFISHDV